MSLTIWVFLAAGALFGLLTFRHRHLFSEGPSRPAQGQAHWSARLGWVALCTLLWPLLTLTGLDGWSQRKPVAVKSAPRNLPQQSPAP